MTNQPTTVHFGHDNKIDITGDVFGGNKYVNIHPAPSGPIFHNVPSLPTHFLGREDLINSLVASLFAGDTLALSAEGLPGVGKTTLAVALAHDPRLRAHFADGVLWAGLGPQGDALRALAAWGTALGLDLSDKSDESARGQTLKNAIAQRRFLLVIDDAWDAQTAIALRVGGPNCCHLLTTRDRKLARSFAGSGHAHSVPVLADDPAFALLRQHAPEACAADEATARRLAQQVGGLPLALELLGGYLAAPERSLFAELSAAAFAQLADPATRLQQAQVRLGSQTGAAETLQATIELSLHALPPPIAAAFYRLGAFAAKPDWFELEGAKAVTDSDAATLATLVSRNLLEKEGERLALHQTLADVARTRVHGEALQRHRDYYLALVNADREDWQRIEAAFGQIQHDWRALADDDPGLMDWMWALSQHLYRRGLWRDYLEWAERAYNQLTNEEHERDRATLLTNLGLVYAALGDKTKALDFYQQALPILRAVGDKGGEATTLHNIGSVYADLGDKTKALDFYQQALPILRAVGDRWGESVTRYNLSMIYAALGNLTGAIEELERVVAIDEAVGHPDLASDRAALARMQAQLNSQPSGSA